MTDPIRALCAEMAAVAERPSDKDILELMPQQFRNDLATVSRMAASGAGTGVTPGLLRVTLNTGAIAFARAVLARLGRPAQPAPPAEGEVAELVAWLHGQDGGLGRRAICARVAELLERHAPVPVPVAVAVDRRLPGPEDCDADERCWLLAPRWILPPDELTHWLPAHALPLPALDQTVTGEHQ